MMVCLMTMGVLNTALPVCAQGPSEEDLSPFRKQIQQLEVRQQAIRDDLKTIKDLLTARAKPPSPVDNIALTLDVGDAPAKSQADAPVAPVEYTDCQTPFCARHSQTVLPQLVKHFIETAKVWYVLRDFPLASIHPHAANAHEAAHCAGEQGKYWELHDLLFEESAGRR
jgi:protein-disulfide isomerase